MSLKTEMTRIQTLVDAALPQYLATPEGALATLYDSMRYSATAGGKRIRPFLVFSFCNLFGGEERAALPFAVAIECVHASSLIHDDLPAMDNDDLRRGKPTNHIVFGEDIALLAGDTLMTRGYEIAAENKNVPAQMALLGVRALLRASGGIGMMGGQQIDLMSENREIDFETLLKMHKKKTGALIAVSARLGTLAAGIEEEADPRVMAAVDYAMKIGLAFQIVDDILDVTGDVSTLGKTTNADGAIGKTTFMTFMSVDEARAYAERLTKEAIAAIAPYAGSEMLIDLASYLLNRDH